LTLDRFPTLSLLEGKKEKKMNCEFNSKTRKIMGIIKPKKENLLETNELLQ
jgi:hypothetical protein